jgi:hypothetical protein
LAGIIEQLSTSPLSDVLQLHVPDGHRQLTSQIRVKMEGVHYLLDQFVTEEDLTGFNADDDIGTIPKGASITTFRFAAPGYWSTLNIHYTPQALTRSNDILKQIHQGNQALRSFLLEKFKFEDVL